MHEYTHAVTDHIAHLYNIENNFYNETYAIHEGNSDYFAGTFTDRTLIGEYASFGISINQRNMTNPRIANYSQYNDRYLSYWQTYGYHEPHFGGELWSASLWDLRNNLSPYVANWDIYNGLFGIPTTSSFLQYRQAIINSDINYYGGLNEKKIRHIFYLRGIGPDSMGVTISGPSYLAYKQTGTYTANFTGGSGSVSYQWYNSNDGGNTWYAAGTNQTQSFLMMNNDITVRCDVHDNQTGENSSARKIVYYGSIPPKIGAKLNNEIPLTFDLKQNHPNPFNPVTQIEYILREDGYVTLRVFDMLGKEVALLVNTHEKAGIHSVNFNAENLSSGIYFYSIRAKDFYSVKKMVLNK